MSILLYSHNEKAYKAVAEGMERGGKAAVVHPTGTGKSFLAFKLVEDHPEATVVWLAPSQYIFQSQVDGYYRHGGCRGRLKNVSFFTYARLMGGKGGPHALCPDYIILDEFHRCGAAQWGKSVAQYLAANPQAKILGLSATSIRYLDGRRDMAQELFDGQTASSMGLGEAIARGILPAPLYVVSLYAYEGELKKLERGVALQKSPQKRGEYEKLLERLKRSLGNARGPEGIFARYMRKDGKYLVFCADKAHMQEMLGLCGRWFGALDDAPHIYRVSYDHPGRRDEFERFCGDEGDHLKLLYCIDMLNEGIHVAGVDGVVLLRPTASPTLYLQQVGRALSASCGKQPVIFDMVNNFEGLSCIDALHRDFEEASAREKAQRGRGVEGQFEIIDEVRDCRELLEGLKKNLTASWEEGYEEARKYYEGHGDLSIPKRYRTDAGFALGGWILTQRRIRAGKAPGVLTKGQIARLDAIGMHWGSASDTNWEKGYRKLEAYRVEYGDVDVAARYVTLDGYPLGRWVANQRLIRNGKQKGVLSEERIRKLDGLGFVWNKAECGWGRYYIAAQEYYRKEGHLEIPVNYVTEDGLKLGAWIGRIRREQGSLDPEKARALEGIGMTWGSRYDAKWEEKFQLARQFYEEHGHLEVPIGYEIQGVRLGRWVSAMRSVRNGVASSNYRLTRERIAQLDAIGMNWEKNRSRRNATGRGELPGTNGRGRDGTNRGRIHSYGQSQTQP